MGEHAGPRGAAPGPPTDPRTGAPHTRSTTGLLDYVGDTSLDEDYRQVAERRRRGGAALARRPGLIALVVLAVFGVMLATAALRTSRGAEESASSRASLVEQITSRRTDLAERRARVRALETQIAARRAKDLSDTRQGRAVQERLTRLGLAAGTLRTLGPGIVVQVDDAPGAEDAAQQVQAGDLQKLVNGLWQAGAEAISINGQRLTAVSPIRDASEAITVNFTSLTRPYIISAVGDPDTLGSDLLQTPGGLAWGTLQSIGLQFAVHPEDSLVLPPADPVNLRSAQERRNRR